MKEHLLMSECSIPTPHQTDTTHFRPPAGSMNRRRSACMNKDVEKWNMLHSPPSATGGLANEASIFYKRLASLLASKWDHPYSSTLCWLRCCLTFSLLLSSPTEELNLHVGTPSRSPLRSTLSILNHPQFNSSYKLPPSSFFVLGKKLRNNKKETALRSRNHVLK